MINTVFFDFGGVIAEEGWQDGLNDIARFHNLDSKKFFDDACDVLWSTGYMYGKATEKELWDGIYSRYELKMSVDEMRGLIFDRFTIRKPMLELVEKIGAKGYRLAILSDQTNWLDEFNEKYGFFSLFEKVYNSYHIGKGKSDQTLFPEVCKDFGAVPAEVLFVDDNAGHIERASNEGLQTVHFTDWKNDITVIEKLLNL
ncbi:HAD-superfamily hydrolase, subfamily IA, variant 3 [Denitrovibrio acetiphilus DSM 12809]|uniref:HAD-superfamily hydrolase, subfamily IA, variant 3 n=1 Tax=Denitrovibrio acetiphilus (strain DSM 12809 / NBRC 114555 / N2460) TaxID=522772 RepID=D4H311_DENA2|nr:HAD family phosphatase [Denitrovibrio acetiphilus]ADD69034.1 HAD-superfamily hydrolase, subfamily IA, variant 3 [Denitrovibrio acetiphilus DSM 12809]